MSEKRRVNFWIEIKTTTKTEIKMKRWWKMKSENENENENETEKWSNDRTHDDGEQQKLASA